MTTFADAGKEITGNITRILLDYYSISLTSLVFE